MQSEIVEGAGCLVDGSSPSHRLDQTGLLEGRGGRNAETRAARDSAHPIWESQTDHVRRQKMDAPQRCIFVRLESRPPSSPHLYHPVGHEEEADPSLRLVIAAGLEVYQVRGPWDYRRCESRRRKDLDDQSRFYYGLADRHRCGPRCWMIRMMTQRCLYFRALRHDVSGLPIPIEHQKIYWSKEILLGLWTTAFLREPLALHCYQAHVNCYIVNAKSGEVGRWVDLEWRTPMS